MCIRDRYQAGKATEEKILKALYTASGIGAVISFRACIAGAAGGCQAEIGSASAMAAGALASLRGGDCKQIGHAAAMALKNLMGLVLSLIHISGFGLTSEIRAEPRRVILAGCLYNKDRMRRKCLQSHRRCDKMCIRDRL